MGKVSIMDCLLQSLSIVSFIIWSTDVKTFVIYLSYQFIFLSSKGSFRLAANLLQPATFAVRCSKNRKISNYSQWLSQRAMLLQPATSVNQAQVKKVTALTVNWAKVSRDLLIKCLNKFELVHLRQFYNMVHQCQDTFVV